MGAVAASAVTINETWYSEGSSGRKLKTVDATIVLSTQGSDTNYIATNLLADLDEAIKVGAFVKSDNTAIYPGAPSYDGTKIYVVDTHAPADVTGTFRVIVTGKYTG